jgi:Tfp pilus assembly protein PilP
MKKYSSNIISLLCVVALFSFFLNSYARANTSKKPVVIRKKIAAQNQKSFRNAAPDRQIKALKPKSDISVILESAEQEEIIAAGTEFSRHVAPVYDPTDKIDPFEPLFKETPEIKSGSPDHAETAGNGATALEKVDLSQLKLTGIILAASGNKALVREASGRGHVISEGTYIGIHRGRVAGVLKDKVIVKEKMKLKGRFFFQEIELKLNKPNS